MQAHITYNSCDAYSRLGSGVLFVQWPSVVRSPSFRGLADTEHVLDYA